MNLAGVSLFGGWFPPTVQGVAIVAMLTAIGWRNRRWRLMWVPLSMLMATAVALGTYWILAHRDLAPQAAPLSFWIWLSATAMMAVLVVVGWMGTTWWRRALSLAAVLLTATAVALAANQWAGFFPTTGRAWQALSSQPLPDQARLNALSGLRGTPQPDGKVVPVRIPDVVSGFRHRTEYVYLPPAWFVGTTPPQLPVVVMIGGVVTTPEDWVRSGDAPNTVRRYADHHNGQAPILVMIDPTGSLTNDTECVDGPNGNVDTHITKEVRPYVISNFSASDSPALWAVVGWSMGGTCAVDLVVRHPDQFGTFVDISGDESPNLGDRRHTITALFGGRENRWEQCDPATVMARHGRYDNTAGWFQSEGHPSSRTGGLTSPQIRAADKLAEVADANNITTVVRPVTGRHNWPFAAHAFADATPWLMQRLQAPT